MRSMVFSLFFLLPSLFLSASTTIRMKVPHHSRIEVDKGEITGEPEKGKYKLTLPDEGSFPLNITVLGPLGGRVSRTFRSINEMKQFKVKTGIIQIPSANPPQLTVLPELCPRLRFDTHSGQFYYDAALDRLNRIPVFQLMDPDVGIGDQYKAYTEMDGKNVLLLLQARLSYDYEDSNIIDYQGLHPLTGKNQVVHEGEGGFYANIHYAVVPYDEKILHLDQQTLLHLVQGKLKDIDREKLRPLLRTHSLIPGPFVSKKEALYQMCEWGDTAYQAPAQTLQYREMALWDWDYSVKNADHLLIVVWEGDEEDWLIQQKLIDPFYLTDDLVAIFEARRGQTLKPLTLQNQRGDFEITIQTGDLLPPLR